MNRRDQRGFALLIVFLMAAAVALMLYQQMPRMAFESEREKEQLLIDRGEQYKRAIQLYYAQFKKYPARIEDLENTNDKRFLRHRFINPYTGKDEWRLIHTNGQYLTDSLVQKPPTNPAQNGAQGLTAAQMTGNTPIVGQDASAGANPADPNAPPQVNATVLRRPSDRPLTPGVNPSLAANSPSDPNNPNNNDPASYPPITLYPNGYNAPPGQPGQPGTGQPVTQPGVVQPGIVQPGVVQPGVVQPGIVQPGGVQAGFPGGVNPTGVPVPFPRPQFPGQPVAGVPPGFPPGMPGQFPGQSLPQAGANPNPAQPPNPQDPNAGAAPVNPVFPQQPGAPAGQPPSALGIIQNLLTTPRQPPPGIGPSTNTTVGGGIAGVASTFEGPTIKSYGKRTKFQEWEFVFQLQTVGMPGTQANPLGAAPNGAQPNGAQPNGAQPGQAGFGQPGFGQPPIGQPGATPQTVAPSASAPLQ